ncbi:aldehyde dehydrogenase family protein [Marinobacterium lutimaris]|uniref:Acyl-CoA reductase n=1 Tax=Marinobacterium lutimaris TaxID=568106 RepID=A0A1H6C0Y4_9GAMM|nr:aldehyde dehydrogenase family protein [Marinobacterium lutimaris]SEG66629.1 Acyl-CoA reductase [Marinobacterium lutimaris]
MNTCTLFINGDRLSGQADAFSVINPATEQPFAQGQYASVEQLDQAVAAARQAFTSWRQVPDAERTALLHKIADAIEANADELARIIVQEQGKPLFLAQVEVGGAVAWTRYNADLEIPVEVIEDSEHKRVEGHRKPLGVVASITPWNWPLMIAIWHIIPALRTGNTVVCKPSGLTPLNTLRLVELINEALPAGVVNLVTGEREIGEAISRHAAIDKVIFTGSTPTGQNIMSNAAGNLKRLTLELGGNDAAIVLPGTDIDAVAEGIFQSAFLNMGQTCAALKRLYVHDSLHDALCDKLAALSEAQVLDNGLNEGVTFGPVQNARQLGVVSELVEDARAQGARILCGGQALERDGYFYPPTIVTDVSNGIRLVDEEQFGPALPVIRYQDLDEAIAMANDCGYGLGGSVWGPDLEQANQVARQLECGTVWINGHAEVLPHVPFGGCKLSGMGVEFGIDGLLEYTQLQIINCNR